MPKDIVTARVTQEQYTRINRLVSDGIFGSRSAVLQTFVELGLEYCNLGKVVGEAATKFRAEAEVATQKAAVYTMIKSITNELSVFIEKKSQREIIDCLDLVKNTIARFSPGMRRQFIELLDKEPVFGVACQMVGKNPIKEEEEEWESEHPGWY